MCQQPTATDEWLHGCLKESTVWIYGDSNAKQIYNALLRRIPTKCRRDFCFNESNRINITYVLHEWPVYSNKTRKIPPKYGLPHFVDMIPETGRHFAIFHYFLHTSRAHPSSLYLRLRAMKQQITKLLYKNPNIQVAVRGPHISALQVLRNHILSGDILGTFAKALYHRTFADLKDRIIFLDGWDMSIAAENTEYHPMPQVAEELVRTFLAFKCS